MAPFQLYVGDEMVYEAPADQAEVVGVRLNTSRGEVARINSDLLEQRVQVTLDYRSLEASTFLDAQEALTTRERANALEDASDVRQDREDSTPSDEEMGLEGKDDDADTARSKAAQRIAVEREAAGGSPLSPEAIRPPVEGGRVQTEEERRLAEANDRSPFTSSSQGSSEGTGEPGANPQGGETPPPPPPPSPQPTPAPGSNLPPSQRLNPPPQP